MKSQDHGREFFAALDIGTDKVLCIVARPGAEPGSMRVIGMGNARSSGVQEGCVVDVQEAVQSIRKAVQEAQYTAEVQLSGVWAAIGGKYLQSANCVGQTVLRGQEVSREDVEQAESNARLAAMREGKGSTVIKLIPQGFRCGDVMTARPIGLVGPKLEAYVHALYGSKTNADNLKRCIQRAGVEVINYEPHPWAAAQAVLSETEKTCGAAVIDIGAQTTSIIVMAEGRVQFTDVRPWGTEIFTRDLAMVLGISLEEAEELKRNSGECRLSQVIAGEVVQFESHGALSRLYSRDLLVKTLAARAQEYFHLYRQLLIDARAFDHVELVVLTGGGAMLPGIADAAAAEMGKRVRIGLPRRAEGESALLQRPDSVVAAGLVQCAIDASALGVENAWGVRRRQGFRERLKTFFIGDY